MVIIILVEIIVNIISIILLVFSVSWVHRDVLDTLDAGVAEVDVLEVDAEVVVYSESKKA